MVARSLLEIGPGFHFLLADFIMPTQGDVRLVSATNFRAPLSIIRIFPKFPCVKRFDNPTAETTHNCD